MTTYRLPEGGTLIVRAGDGPWRTVTFTADAIADLDAATAAMLEPIFDTIEGITARADDAGRLVLLSEDTGETAAIAVHPDSTAAGALGLTPNAHALGSGPGAASLVGFRSETFPLERRATMTVYVDGKARKLIFNQDGDEGPLTAAQAAEAINARLRRTIARATGDGRVRLVSPTLGVGSRITVHAPSDPDTPDAAAVFGFTGDNAHSEPYVSTPASLVCPPPPASGGTVVVENLTAAPIELQLPTGRSVLPARGHLVIAREALAAGPLQRLIARGSVRMSPERNT